MAGTLAPTARQQFFDADGDPVSGGLLYTYASGTTTALPVFTDSLLSVPHPNPVVLDSAGRATLYLSAASYRFVLHDADDVAVWTVDPVQAVAPYSVNLDIDGVAGEGLPAGSVVYISTGINGTVAGRWYLTDADATEKSSLAPMVGMVPATIAQGSTGTIRLQGRLADLTALAPGAAYYCSATAGALTISPPTNARLVGVADSTTSIILYSAAVGNAITTSSLSFVPLASAGTQSAIVATINATNEGIRIAASLIQIDGTVQFSAGYDPSAKIPTGGAAADVNSGLTTISGGKITSGSITASQIAAGTITGDRMVAGTVTATQIAAGAVTADKLNVTTLSAVSANIGTVTAGTINGVTILSGTGVTVSPSGITITAPTAGSQDNTRAYRFTGTAGGYNTGLYYWESSSHAILEVYNASSKSTTMSRLLSNYAPGYGTAIVEATSVPNAASVSLTASGVGGYSAGEVIVNAARLRPGTGGTYDLGSQAYKWGNIYLTLPNGGTHYVLTDSTGALFLGSAV